MELLDLPVEVLATLFTYLDGSDLARVSQTCRRLNHVTETDFIWQKRCVEEFCFPCGSNWNGTYQDIYCKVLYKYGHLLGSWRDCSNCYGGLIQIWYANDGHILGEELFSPKDVSCDLLRKPLFEITLTTDLEVKVTWVVPESYGGAARPCNIQKHAPDDDDSKMEVIITWDSEPIKMDKAEERQAQKVMRDESLVKGSDPDLYSYRWETVKQQSQMLLKRHVTVSRCPEDLVPLQPGLFKALYGGHGTEILHVSYEDDYTKLVATKISGDPNVPAHEVSVRANIQRPLVLRQDQQVDLQELRELTRLSSIQEGFKRESLHRQPFVVPGGVDLRGEAAVPDFCLARYYCTGTVSPTGYKHPSQVMNNLMVIDEDTFWVLWLELWSMARFCRVKEQLPSLNR